MTALSSENVFNSLIGNWTYRRIISNYGVINGQATFKRIAEDELLYREDGVLELNGNEIPAFREYKYLLEGNVIYVYFVEGESSNKLFHPIDFDKAIETDEGLSVSSYHLCIRDHYEPTYVIQNDNEFEIRYKVKGPKKDYISNTKFVRI